MPPNSNSKADILLRLLYEDRFTAEMDKSITHFEERMKKATSVQELESLERQWKEVETAIKEAEKAAKQEAKTVEDASKRKISQLKAEARALSATANEIQNGFETARTGVFRNIASQVESLSRA